MFTIGDGLVVFSVMGGLIAAIFKFHRNGTLEHKYDPEKVVFKDVCAALHSEVDTKFSFLREDIKEIKTHVKEIKDLLQPKKR